MYVIGLGNPGEKYATTRHNVGWMVLDRLRENNNCKELVTKKHWHALTCDCQDAFGRSLTLVYPQTYMNRSGETVCAILHDNVDAALIVIHDDIALPIGTIKISQGRGDGGHNGVKSIRQHAALIDMVRVRVGVAGKRWWGNEPYVPTGADLPKHVLSTFSWRERAAITRSIETAAAATLTIVTDGTTTAMNKFNQRPKTTT